MGRLIKNIWSVAVHYKKNTAVAKISAKLRKNCALIVGDILKHYREPGNLDVKDAEDVAINVVGMVVVNPSISSRQIEAESGISRRRALSVLKKHKFRPYTIRKQQQLLPTDLERRLDFCNWYLQQIEQDQLFFKNIIWTDESYVSSAGIFNRHNKHYWSEDNPHQTVDVQNQGRFGFSVWCALYNNRILAYQLYDDNLNGQRYYNMINYHIVEEFLDNLPLNERRHVFFNKTGHHPIILI
ncbi:hypothetical protein NQ318_018524 [Aromia moschata]|uniref:Transposase n=1 Tax=Aromia moschata TaxID=1265417 RepID=A0AAV8ZGG6_9CUCU|nr:hypothetical protein NQ318_018524 [Aromia moschata]